MPLSRCSPLGALTLAAVCWLGTLPAAAAGAGAPDPVFPGLGNSGYRALRYDLDFSYLPATRTVDGTTTITARSSRPLDRFELDSLGLAVHSVLVDGQPAGFALHDEKLAITPARAVPAGAVLTVQVRYTADPRAQLPHSGWVPTPDGFAVAGQPDSAHTVFPCDDVPGAKAEFTIRVSAPDELLGVANGTLDGSTEQQGRTTRTYTSREPMATELVQVTVGRYTVRERQGPAGVLLRDVVPTARAAALEPALALTPGQLGWIEQRLGDFPLESYGLLPVNTDDPDAFAFTGLETQTLTLYKPGFLEQPEAEIGSHMMHELVHSWFGDSVTPSTWADLWLNEGHADYYGLLYRYDQGWPDSLGLDSLDERMRDTYAQGDQWRHDSGPVAAPSAPATLFDSQRYLGGVLVLYALRQKVGDADFQRIERTFLQRFHSGTAGTQDYIAVASEVSGQDLSGFLGDWLYGTRTPPMPGHPDWTVAAAQTQRATPRGTATF
ncbi:aminopeptidase N [Kitasatospora sp. MAP12-15]|uniref:M1 family metallopeptidase n=1 Tax=unclassified Kitasatospora TaxID=2633591 RepID=UPI0024768B2F|nr:M1 family metallopeptidase [Kitasatospora sp. MAP12-44]